MTLTVVSTATTRISLLGDVIFFAVSFQVDQSFGGDSKPFYGQNFSRNDSLPPCRFRERLSLAYCNNITSLIEGRDFSLTQKNEQQPCLVVVAPTSQAKEAGVW